MYSQLHLKIANIINNNYYDKLIINLAKEKYNNPNFIIDPNNIDHKFLIDVDNKIIDLMYNDLINETLFLEEEQNNINKKPLDIKERIQYIYNKSNKGFDTYTNVKLAQKLIENKNYNVLHDILVNSNKNKIKYFLEDELYTKIGYYDTKIHPNKVNKTIKFNEENMQILDFLGIDDTIKKQYLINFINNLNTYLNDEVNDYIEDKYEYKDINKKRKELYSQIIEKYLIELNDKSCFNFDDSDIKDNLEYIIKNIEQNNHYSIFIINLMNYLNINEYEQYLTLKNNFDPSHSIFKYLTDNEDYFENKNYLIKNHENILEIKNENVSLIKQLLTTIKDEPDLNNKKIMFDKLMTHLKINLEFKDLDFLYVNTKKEIKDLNKEDFEKDFLFKINDFDNKIKDLDIN